MSNETTVDVFLTKQELKDLMFIVNDTLQYHEIDGIDEARALVERYDKYSRALERLEDLEELTKLNEEENPF